MNHRALFECTGCGMQIHLLAPVERPCPACGQTFIEVPEDIDLGYKPPRRNRQEQVVAQKENEIDRIVREAMPGIIEGFEDLLREHANGG